MALPFAPNAPGATRSARSRGPVASLRARAAPPVCPFRALPPAQLSARCSGSGRGRAQQSRGPVLCRASPDLVDHKLASLECSEDHTLCGYQCLGLGQAMVDFSACVDDAFLAEFGVEKGKRRLISHEERGRVLSRLDGESYKCNAGGSLSNTLVALSRLSAAAGAPLRVGLAAAVGGDALGDFYQAKMEKAGVGVAALPLPEGTTGTVIVLTTPDAQRTFLSFLGDSARPPQLAAGALAHAQLLVVEGYLLEQAETAAAIAAVVREVRAGGVLVALTCADAGVVRGARAAFTQVLDAGVDVLFANAGEATELTGLAEAADSAAELSRLVKLAVVTDGSRGAHLATAQGAKLHAPPHWTETAPVDTCGAGDAYAAGVLYSLLHSASLAQAGAFGARVASSVISRNGARLTTEAAEQLAAAFLYLDPSEDQPRRPWVPATSTDTQ